MRCVTQIRTAQRLLKRRIIIVVIHDHRHAHRGCSVGYIAP
jgi:hypothetical protein